MCFSFVLYLYLLLVYVYLTSRFRLWFVFAPTLDLDSPCVIIWY